MENTALILIVITLLLLVIIVGLLTALLFKMFRQQTAPAPTTLVGEISKKEFHPEILDRMKTLEKVRPRRSELFCPNHPEEPGETMCSICDRLYCRSCIKPFKSLHFCREHLPLIMRSDWEEVVTVKTSTHDPEEGVRLYDVKKELFEATGLPTYVETHYKINVDQDYIETYLVVYAQAEELPRAKEKFVQFLSNSGLRILDS